MNQSAILKKKGSNPNKAQSPLKNLDADMQYRSSAELVNTFKIKRENVSNERNHKAKKEHAPTTHRRKNSEDLIPQQGKRLDDLEGQEEIGEDECDIGEEVDIDCSTKGQPVGPIDKIVSELTNFIGTIARNPRFINLMYTSWHAVPKDIKKRMWEYINAISEVNSQNRKKQQWRNRMGPINFARVRVALLTTNINFIQQAELQNHQNSRETTDDAFRAVFGKEQPGRLRCYGRSVTTSSLKKDEETNKLKQKHANEISSLKEEMREEMRHFFSRLLQNNPGLNVQDIPGVVGSNLVSPVDASSAQAVRGQNILHSSGATHDSVLQKDPYLE
uniref:Ubiquitin n=1 Tax=Solanum tuberosum TaxID=4113 RepID=M1DPG5_SOLTU